MTLAQLLASPALSQLTANPQPEGESSDVKPSVANGDSPIGQVQTQFDPQGYAPEQASQEDVKPSTSSLSSMPVQVSQSSLTSSSPGSYPPAGSSFAQPFPTASTSSASLTSHAQGHSGTQAQADKRHIIQQQLLLIIHAQQCLLPNTPAPQTSSMVGSCLRFILFL